ncbi:hypothetical protein EV1_027867 [Malus domestica]
MVSTRRSGSFSGNNNKRSSSFEDKPPSSKRSKADNGSASEKVTPRVKIWRTHARSFQLDLPNQQTWSLDFNILLRCCFPKAPSLRFHGFHRRALDLLSLPDAEP